MTYNVIRDKRLSDSSVVGRGRESSVVEALSRVQSGARSRHVGTAVALPLRGRPRRHLPPRPTSQQTGRIFAAPDRRVVHPRTAPQGPPQPPPPRPQGAR